MAGTAAQTPLKPLIKWAGGKRRELDHIRAHLPAFAARGGDWQLVEPFVGGGAVFFALAAPRAVINDLDPELVNFYRVVADQDERFLAAVDDVAGLFADADPDEAARRRREEAYCRWRDLDRGGGLAGMPAWQRAARFCVVSQLAFSGMRRFNADGEFNVPFGHYKRFNAASVKR